MIDESCRSKPQTANCAAGAENKRRPCEDGSRAPVAKDGAPPTSQAPGRTSASTFTAAKHGPLGSVVGVGTSPTDLPAWACQKPAGPAPREEIASHAAGRLHTGSVPIDPLMTVGAAAALLHVSTKTVRRLIDRGDLDRVRIGRLVRIRPADIKALILESSND
jgi:excisionase family DNA binding protein